MSNTEDTTMLNPATLAATGLAVMSQDWNVLGLGVGDAQYTAETGDLNVLQQRITAILVARCAAVDSSVSYKDYSVKTICKTAVKKGWPASITETVISELAEFVKRMLTGYKDVPYHNRKHAYHVVLSTSKLTDMMILSGARTYGLKYDPLALLALAFAALCHDVEHQGIPNRQLAVEDDRLAVLYNDQSMAENWSLYVAFSELLQDEFQSLRTTIFHNEDAADAAAQHEYRRFRKLVVNLVLCTDIASPERTQIGKSKWKEAFGDPFETVERKLREEQRYHQQQHHHLTGRTVANRRGSAISSMSHNHPSDHYRRHTNEEDDDSLSGTPEPSESEDYDDEHHSSNNLAAVSSAPKQQQQQLLEKVSEHVKDSALRNKLERRLSTTSMQSSKYRQRLGILRTLDLSGETLETYERRGSMHTASGASVASSTAGTTTAGVEQLQLQAADEPDDLRAAVVMETIMTAADVAHNLQGWDHMVKWSGRLYMELRRAFVAKRGFDPQEKWFENQIGFLESYLLPVARRLEDTGVFGEEKGQIFAATVEANRDKWLTHGYDESKRIIAAGAKKYPLKS